MEYDDVAELYDDRDNRYKFGKSSSVGLERQRPSTRDSCHRHSLGASQSSVTSDEMSNLAATAVYTEDMAVLAQQNDNPGLVIIGGDTEHEYDAVAFDSMRPGSAGMSLDLNGRCMESLASMSLTRGHKSFRGGKRKSSGKSTGSQDLANAPPELAAEMSALQRGTIFMKLTEGVEVRERCITMRYQFVSGPHVTTIPVLRLDPELNFLQ